MLIEFVTTVQGRCWVDPEDTAAGWSGRAAFPFILTSHIENESYYGLATFLYTGHEVSALRYQIVQQLANFLILQPFTAAGQPALTYDPSATAHATQAFQSAFEEELAGELPWKDWAELEGKGCHSELLAGVRLCQRFAHCSYYLVSI